MSSATILLAAVSLLPAITGPVVAERGSEAMVALCGGGTISIPLGGAPAPGEGSAPCCAKGCHSGQSRKKPGCCADLAP